MRQPEPPHRADADGSQISSVPGRGLGST
jgi:hypothetical protein